MREAKENPHRDERQGHGFGSSYIAPFTCHADKEIDFVSCSLSISRYPFIMNPAFVQCLGKWLPSRKVSSTCVNMSVWLKSQTCFEETYKHF